MITIGIIKDAVCEYFGIDEMTMFSKSRQAHIVHPRQFFHYVARKHLYKYGYSLSKIGSYFNDVTGNVWNHASVINSIKNIEGLIDVYRFAQVDYECIMDIIRRKIDEEKAKNIEVIVEPND